MYRRMDPDDPPPPPPPPPLGGLPTSASCPAVVWPWKPVFDAAVRCYYFYNMCTGDTTWDKPVISDVTPDPPAARDIVDVLCTTFQTLERRGVGLVTIRDFITAFRSGNDEDLGLRVRKLWQGGDVDISRPVSLDEISDRFHSGPLKDWQTAICPESGNQFYHHVPTGKTQWEAPELEVATADQCGPSSTLQRQGISGAALLDKLMKMRPEAAMQASPVSATPAQSSAGATVLSHEPIDGIEHDSMVLDLMVKRERERIRETDDRATRQSQRRVELRQQFKGVTGEHKLFAGLLRPHLDAPRDVPKFEPTARGRAYTVSAPSVFDRLNNTKVGLEDCESKGTRRSCAPTHPHLFVTLQLYPWTCCSLTSHPTPGPRMACAALHRITSTSL